MASDAAIRGVLHPVAVDLLNPVLSAQLGLKNFTLALMFAGNEAVIARSNREVSAAAASSVGIGLARCFRRFRHSSTMSAFELSRASVAAEAAATKRPLTTPDLARLSRNSRRPSGGNDANALEMSL